MAVKEILLLGNPLLYETAAPVDQAELAEVEAVVRDLHDTLLDFRSRFGAGRAIAAPQIGVMKRIIYMYIDEPVVFINPTLAELSAGMFELWDDCMSFPDLLVRVQRHQQCTIRYRDEHWQERETVLTGPLSELLQHEYDHLNGVLAVQRATGSNPLALRSQRHLVEPQRNGDAAVRA